MAGCQFVLIFPVLMPVIFSIFYIFLKVFESIPQIPIHVTEIKKLILKDNPGYTVESNLDEDRLLNVLTNGSTGRNPTFFKAYGHEDVFGLRSAIPEGRCKLLSFLKKYFFVNK